MPSSTGLPLAGVRVVDFTHYLAGPHLTRSLAALGADVIKIERPKVGEAGRSHPYFVGGQSGYFLQQNMGKRGVCVDLKDPRGKELLTRLIETADVFVENYRPGTMRKLGLGFEALAALNPRLIYCSISAYGHTGPKSSKAGFGLIAEAESGAMAQMGSPNEPPPLMRMPIADMYTGVHGVAAVCAALFGRERNGEGCHIDLALYDCMVSMHDFAIQSYTLSGGREIPKRFAHDLPDATVYGVFGAKDGYIVIAAQVDDAWLRLARLMGGDELARDERFHGAAQRNAHREEALKLVRGWVESKPSKAGCIEALEQAGVPCASVQQIDEVLRDPQVKARGMIVEHDHPTLGKIKLPNLPFRFSNSDTSPQSVAPMLGEHNRAIAREIGLSEAHIDELEADGVLVGEFEGAPAAA